ncbi:MFS transporter [Actinomadura rubrobrunea]|uniref:MFS transporter n=1 Tax=Actinomadura rubrobrunea TaxID=115335 RepID=A0A9W6USU1_9ACTN|nr:MFS transporter [Actinomadura rubrobrunea]GLW62971.1 MFS transporter [Actinomadura rubrobrunea]
MTAADQPTSAPPAGRVAAFLRPRLGGLPRPFWALWTGTLLNRVGTMVEPYLGLYLTTARDLSLRQAGAVLAVLGIGTMAGQVVGGALADRIGRRATLTLAALAAGAGMLALGGLRGMPAITAAALVTGVAVDMWRPASAAMVADLVPPAERPRAFGLLFWATNLGFSAAMVAGGALARAGYHWLFWIDALTCAIFGLLVWRAVPETRPERAGGRASGGFAAVLRDRVMIAFRLICLVYTVVLLQYLTTMPLAMKEHGLGPETYGLVIAVNGVVIVTMQPLVGAWLSRRDHSLVLVAGFLLLGAGNALTALASQAWAYAGAVAVGSLGEVVAASVLQAVVAGLAPVHLRGRYNAMWGLAWSGGFLLAPVVGTQLLEHGSHVLWPTCAALTVGAAAAQLALAPAIRRRDASGCAVA